MGDASGLYNSVVVLHGCQALVMIIKHLMHALSKSKKISMCRRERRNYR